MKDCTYIDYFNLIPYLAGIQDKNQALRIFGNSVGMFPLLGRETQ